MKAGSLTPSSMTSLPEPEAAVGIIRCLVPEEAVLLVRRIQSERDPWSGHYAFPGGRREARDETIYDTCVREVFEETGIDLAANDLLRTLPPTPAGRNVRAPILVQPFIFEVSGRPTVIVEEKEIDSYLWLSARSFSDAGKHLSAEVLPNMVRPIFPLDDYYVWGFTYGLLCSYFGFSPASPGGRTF